MPRTLLRLMALTAVVLSLGPAAWAQDLDRDVTKVGTTAATFLNIPVGARASAMGGAIAASVDDATSIYWNPAGLGRMTTGALAVEYADWLAGLDFNYAAVAVPTRLGTFGVAVTSMRTDEMEVTTETQPGGTGQTFDAGSLALALSYGRALTDRFQIGGSVKFIRETVWNSASQGVAIDVGTVFTTPFQGIRLGAAITNFGTKMHMTGDDLLVPVDIAPDQSGNNQSTRGELQTEQFDLPLTMRIGLAAEVYETAGSRVTLAVDALSPNNNEQYVNVGGEVALLGGLIAFRGGYNELFLQDSVRSFTLGGGLNYGFGNLNVGLDYAYEAQEYFDGVNRFTFAVMF